MFIYLAEVSAQLYVAFSMCGRSEMMLFMDNVQLYRHCIYFTIT